MGELPRQLEIDKGETMNRHHALKLIALLSVTILPLGTVACSNGSSPTEPAFLGDDAVVTSATSASTSSVAAVSDDSQTKGNDDRGGDNHGGKSGKGGKNGKGGRDDKAPRAGKEFEGAVASVGQDSLTLRNGTRIVVNGQTQFVA